MPKILGGAADVQMVRLSCNALYLYQSSIWIRKTSFVILQEIAAVGFRDVRGVHVTLRKPGESEIYVKIMVSML